MPIPEIPPLFLIKDMLLSCILIAIITFVNNYSMVDLFSKKHKYKTNSTQEFFAYGSANVFGSFFQCYVSGASLPRSCVQDNCGGKTQVSYLKAVNIR